MKQEKKGEKDNVIWSEFGSHDVYRRFKLPNPIEVDKVTANLLEQMQQRTPSQKIVRPANKGAAGRAMRGSTISFRPIRWKNRRPRADPAPS